MKELSRKAQKKTGAARTNLQASEPTKEYVLKSLLPSKIRRQFIDREEDHTFRGFVSSCRTRLRQRRRDRGAGPVEALAAGVRHDDSSQLGNVGDAQQLCLQRYLMKEKGVGSTARIVQVFTRGARHGQLPTEVDKYVTELMRGHNDEDGNGGKKQHHVRPWAHNG